MRIAPVDNRLHERHGRGLPMSRWRTTSSSASGEAPRRSGLIGTPEPADRGGVVQVVAIGGAMMALASSRIGTSAGRPATLGLAPRDRPGVEREAPVPAPADRDEPELGGVSCSAR
jgi:hypothetical protein